LADYVSLAYLFAGSDREILPSSNDLTFPIITGIIDKSTAHKAGLLPKDVILEVVVAII